MILGRFDDEEEDEEEDEDEDEDDEDDEDDEAEFRTRFDIVFFSGEGRSSIVDRIWQKTLFLSSFCWKKCAKKLKTECLFEC